ncbi:MAG: phosphomannomutase [Clostridia bacterium]|nr:phosphomannomutase [Clostridia bacterium]
MIKFDPSEIKTVAMDLDGTLTQHKSPLIPSNRAALDKLGEKYKLLIVGAGQVGRIYKQLDYPIDIIGNYGLQYAVYDKSTASQRVLRDLAFPCDRTGVLKRADMLRKELGFTSFYGDSVQFHPSGCLTFPLLGTDAPLSEKLAFDPDRSKRRAVYKRVCEVFCEYRVFVGGSSSFDMAPSPHDKFNALDLYCRENGYAHKEVVFIGDDYGPGGNDESVFVSDFPCLGIDDYRDFPELVAPLIL